jgi:hypothetical protein
MGPRRKEGGFIKNAGDYPTHRFTSKQNLQSKKKKIPPNLESSVSHPHLGNNMCVANAVEKRYAAQFASTGRKSNSFHPFLLGDQMRKVFWQ